MTMSAVTAADYGGSLPLVSISCPDAGEKAKAEDIRAPVAALLAEAEDIRAITTDLGTDKVNIAGDTMTDALEITVSSANTPALDVYGNGTGAGVVATGGATGIGGVFTAGGGNTAGLSSTGAGTGAGAALTGGTTGPGLTAVNGTAQTNTAPTCAAQFAGYLELIGIDPNPTIDPGADNVLHGANIIKAWATLDDAYAIRDGYNVASITTVLGDVKKFTFVRPMADNKYGVKIHVHGDVARSGSHNGLANKLAGEFQFVLYDTTTGATGLGGVADEIYIEVTGRQ